MSVTSRLPRAATEYGQRSWAQVIRSAACPAVRFSACRCRPWRWSVTQTRRGCDRGRRCRRQTRTDSPGCAPGGRQGGAAYPGAGGGSRSGY